MEKSEVKKVICTLRWSENKRFYIFTSENIKYTLYINIFFLHFTTLYIINNDVFIVDNVISISLKVPSITIVLSMGSLNGKKCLSEGHLRFLSNFPFVNLQIKSIVESLPPIMSCTQTMKNYPIYSKICIFG